jgi:molybdate transport system permease protein
VPLSRRGFITAGSLAFAHTIGEFGIILMIGGSIPGETRVLSIALFDHVESLNYQNAHMLALGLVIFSFLLLLAIYTLNRAPQEQNRGLRSHVS